MFLVISSSLHPQSRSRTLARRAAELIRDDGEVVEFIDLCEFELPRCDGANCYEDEHVQEIANKIRSARGILLGVPIYNYQAGSSVKNLIELTGKAWEDTVVGFLCAAGGRGSYMSVMSLANSLMLDFRTFILPRFIYTTGDMVTVNEEIDDEVLQRLKNLTRQLVKVAKQLTTDKVE
jgi:FMN reductase